MSSDTFAVSPTERRHTFFSRSLEARFPKTNSKASITFDFPLPLGPTIDVKFLWKGPIS